MATSATEAKLAFVFKRAAVRAPALDPEYITHGFDDLNVTIYIIQNGVNFVLLPTTAEELML